ncbi:hypothetical protein F2Q69_00021032 [Brassica cretica]|uniref:Uncharacterized protein n=1 Tax=Brassica cretica TaxID=69181 RepID=A0A8S9QAR0_BRACR|nr:hypothetical protein F2Q69_00021032 [Brassica cretica]
MQSLRYSRERPLKRARWTQDADLQKLDDFEKLEAKSNFEKLEAKSKEENEQGEDGDEVGESEGEDSDNRDYDQNVADDRVCKHISSLCLMDANNLGFSS